MRTLFLLLLLVSLACADRQLPDDALDLVLSHGQYITAFLGADGREIVLRVRFDSSYIAIYSPIVAGSSFDNITQSDHISLGAGHGFRWRVRYTYQGDPYVSDPGDSDERTSHQGVLGLGAASPVWNSFDSWTRTPTRLILGWHMASGTEFTDNSRIRLDLSSDYTAVAWPVLSEWLNESARDPQFIARVQLVAGVSILVPMNDSSKNNKPLVHVLEEDSPSEMRLGFAHLRYISTSQVVSQASSGVWTLNVVSAALLPVRLTEYLWLFVGLFLATWCWYPSLAELLQRVYWAYPAETGRQRERTLREANWSLVSSANLWAVLFALFVIHGCLQSYKAMQAMAEPYGNANSTLALVVYYGMMASIVAVFALANPNHISMASVLHRVTALYMLGWLVIVPHFHEGINIIFMVLLAALVFIRQADLLIREVYLGKWWRVAAWTVTTAAAGWFFAFYTLAEYIDERWPGHPSAFFIEAFALAMTWTIGSLELFVREHYVHLRDVARKLSGDPRIASSVPEVMRPSPVPLVYAYNASTGGMTGATTFGQGF